MKRKYITLLAATTLLCAACSNSDDAESIYPESDLAVHFTAGVESLATRATTAAAALAEGTTVRISRDGSTYYNYQSTDANGTLAPTGSDFVTWAATKENNILIYACSPAANELSSDISTAQEFTLTTDQSDGTAVADYATFVGTVSRLGSKLGASDYNDVTFTLQRRMSQVNFSIGNYDPKFEGYRVAVRVNSPASKVRINYALDNTGMTDDYIATLSTEGEPRSVTPYNGVLTLAKDIANETTTAIITPNAEVAANEKFVSLTLTSPNGDYSTAMDVVGIPVLEAGKSYKFELTLSDDRVYIGSVKVISWVDQHLEGTEDASLDLTDPYVLNLSLYANSTDAELYDQLYEAFTECQNLTTLQITGDLGDRSLSTLLGSGDSRVSMKRLDMSALTGLTEIPSSLFSGNTNLQDVKLSEAVTTINSSAFYGCTSLTNFSAPNVTTIDSYALRGCTSLTNFSAPNVTTFDSYALSGCTSLTNFSAPNVTTINSSAFYGCTSLTNFSAPNLTTINSGAFSGCTSLTNFSAPNVTTINRSAFYGCTSLTNFSASNLTTINSEVFFKCNSLTSISAPNVTTINWSAFYGCESLEEVSFPEATSIQSEAFEGCIALKNGNFPKVTFVSSFAFYNCTNLEMLYLPRVTEVYYPFGWVDASFSSCDLTLNNAMANYVSGNVFTQEEGTCTFKSIILVTVDADGNVTPVTE